MAVKTISPHEVFRLANDAAQKNAPRAPQIIDVRTPAEFEQLHAQGAELVPLDELEPRALLASRNGSSDQPLYIICRTGSRAAKACERFAAAGFRNAYCIEGGTLAWEQAGLPVKRGTSKVISLERQVRIAAGSLVLLGIALGFFVHPVFFGLSGFVGAGLVFAGATDWCGMAMLLAKMPWNRKGG
jgi:rhodanese-related sulfurtransferase